MRSYSTPKPNKSTNLDKVVDFNVKDDASISTTPSSPSSEEGHRSQPGKLSKAFFTIGDKAKDKNDYVVYDNKKGVLYYDEDGSGGRPRSTSPPWGRT